MIFVRTVRVGYIEKAIDIYSRRGAENAKENNLSFWLSGYLEINI